jgi:hypothetical protein
LNHDRYYWDLTFIIDLTFTSIVLLPQLAAWVYADGSRAVKRALLVWTTYTLTLMLFAVVVARAQVVIPVWAIIAAGASVAVLLAIPATHGAGFRWGRPFYCRIGVLTLAVYLVSCAVAHRLALKQVNDFAKAAGIVASRTAALPAPPSLLQWSGLILSPGGVYRASIGLGHSARPEFSFFKNSDSNAYLVAAESIPAAQTYLWFARFPWFVYRQADGSRMIEIRDLQFAWPPRAGTPPFTFRVWMDERAHVTGAGLLER